MRKRIVCLLLACCMAFGCLVGCNNKESESSSIPEGNKPINPETTGNRVVSADGVITSETNAYESLKEYETVIGEKLTLTEAPSLAKKVASGELPVLQERLPVNPLVLLPLSTNKTVGTYGGDLHIDNMIKLGTFDDPLDINMYAMLKGEAGYSENTYMACIDSMEINDGSTEYTFHIREGLRWSDGEPCTTDDVAFWWNDIIMNEECDIKVCALSTVEKVEIIDKQTFKMYFPAPYNLYDALTAPMAEMFAYPKHYCSQFHPDYAGKEAVQALVEKTGNANWSDLIRRKGLYGDTTVYKTGYPSLQAYMCTEESETQVIYERNPYYYAVDAKGQQLPYIDRIVIDLTVADAEVARLRVLNGDSDFYHCTGLDFMPAAREAAESTGKVSTALWASDRTNQTTVNLNQNTSNKDLLPLFRNKNFRFALSHAINRQEIIDLNYLGLLEPKQTSWSKRSKYYSEKANNAGLEYDPAKANELLDGLGLDKRDADGWRLLANGKRLELNMAYPINTQFNVKDGELIMEYFKAVGIYTTLKGFENGVFFKMRSNAEYDVAVAFQWGTNEGIYVGADDLGITREFGWWAPKWTRWYKTKGAEGEEPVPEILEALKYYDQYKVATSEEERAKCWEKITDLYAENLWTIGICEFSGFTVVYNSRLKNVPDTTRDYGHGDRGRVATWYFGE